MKGMPQSNDVSAKLGKGEAISEACTGIERQVESSKQGPGLTLLFRAQEVPWNP